jgi:2-aminoadipate transaminase
LSQCVALELLRDREWFAEHLSFLRALYRDRAQTLVDTLTDRLGDRITIAPVHGGLFAWVRFVDGTDADDLFARAVGHGVAFVPGSSFSVDAAHRAAARLCFASLPPARLVDAAARLPTAATECSGGALRVSTPVKRQQNGSLGEGAVEVDDGDRGTEDDHDEAQLLRG